MPHVGRGVLGCAGGGRFKACFADAPDEGISTKLPMVRSGLLCGFLLVATAGMMVHKTDHFPYLLWCNEGAGHQFLQ